MKFWWQSVGKASTGNASPNGRWHNEKRRVDWRLRFAMCSRLPGSSRSLFITEVMHGKVNGTADKQQNCETGNMGPTYG